MSLIQHHYGTVSNINVHYKHEWLAYSSLGCDVEGTAL